MVINFIMIIIIIANIILCNHQSYVNSMLSAPYVESDCESCDFNGTAINKLFIRSCSTCSSSFVYTCITDFKHGDVHNITSSSKYIFFLNFMTIQQQLSKLMPPINGALASMEI